MKNNYSLNQNIASDELPPYITVIKAWRHGETYANQKRLLSGGGHDDVDGTTNLNEEGKKQAAELGIRLVQSGNLDIIYSSDLSRALDTAGAVLAAYNESGKLIEMRTSKQLREILHGEFELTESLLRNEAGATLLHKLLSEDLNQQVPEDILKDRFRFWKTHPLISADGLVHDEIIDVESYLESKETRPETPYQLLQRMLHEFTRIAKEHPGATIGISTHGACLSVLIESLEQDLNGLYIPPYYNHRNIIIDNEIKLSHGRKVENCALIQFNYDSRDGGRLASVYTGSTSI